MNQPKLAVLSFALCVPAAMALAQPAPAPSTPPPAPASAPAAAPGATTGVPGAPRLPPFAGAIVNFDRRGDRVVACVDRSSVPAKTPAMPSPPGSAPELPPSYRIWVIEREVMQELLTTGGLCDPAWSPDGKAFAAAGDRGVYVFTGPNFEPRTIVSAAVPAGGPAGTVADAGPTAAPNSVPKVGATRAFTSVSWSPSGQRLAFLVTATSGTSVKVVEAKDGTSVFAKEQPVKLVQWGADDKSLVIDGTRVTVP